MEAVKEQIDIEEAVQIAAVDGVFFGEFFLPKTFRMPSPPYAPRCWDALEARENRYVSIEIFRGGFKTTLARAFAMKRICYAISHTMEIVGKSQAHAINSVAWIMRQVESNTLLAQTFGLRKGKKWTPEYCEIYHGVEDTPISIVAMGIDGSVRGVNIDDFRPDFILLDDVIDDDNAATLEQRTKVNERIFGAIEKSLARAAEQPDAKMAMIQTPIDRDDAAELTQRDEEWHPIKISCFTVDGGSAWPAMFPVEELKKQKQSHIRRNMLSLWMREMECTVVGDEKRYFSTSWLYTWVVEPTERIVAIGIDPSPPKDEDPKNKKRKDPDPEVISVVAIEYVNGIKRRYILEYSVIQDPNPEKTTQEFDRLARRWHPVVATVETVAYQRTLKWYLERAMDEKRCKRVRIEAIDDKRSKVKRIRQFFTKACDSTEGSELYYHSSMLQFIAQFQDYPDVSYDDILDSIAIGFAGLEPYEGVTVDGEFSVGFIDDDDDVPSQGNWRAAP